MCNPEAGLLGIQQEQVNLCEKSRVEWRQHVQLMFKPEMEAGKLDGLFWMVDWSRVVFFSNGVTEACLKDDLKQPGGREELSRVEIDGRMSGGWAVNGEREEN